MALTDINSEDRLIQQTFAEHLEQALGWETVYANNAEIFGPQGMLGRKRNAETENARVDAEALLDEMLAKDRLLDLVENFILFDDSRAGGTRKVVARNHQVLGVNNAVGSVLRQEELKREFPPERRLVSYTVLKSELLLAAEESNATATDVG